MQEPKTEYAGGEVTGGEGDWKTWTPNGKGTWIVFRAPDGTELAAITAQETTAEEIAQTVGLLAYEHDLMPTDITMNLEQRNGAKETEE